MSIEIVPDWMVNLETEDVAFIRNFLLASGSLKEIAALYKVTYPTVRLRLDKIIQKVNILEKENDDNFIKLIKRLAINEKLDVETAKILIKQYKENKCHE